ncbi:MAG: EscU/YscU/HrcU family type III secretion system export apparatus switch protein [Pseudomonadota bacterium]|nr:hypothetical protein [Gammaproteobacteria bacterium]MEC8010511.1 EscU/YscU/HrcU family type III secretion system export apparatus switch protein [Pseudomonadota bacterium]|tara:strand:- start:3878 stop:4234 length:357 start_codon:yes stop_codon:yes gene_type:complete
MGQRTDAIAIEWKDENEIPFVSAIGQGLDAEAIIETAIQSRVPIFDNPLLMQELMLLQKNDLIPPHLYIAVAQILAFVKYMDGEFALQDNNDATKDKSNSNKETSISSKKNLTPYRKN